MKCEEVSSWSFLRHHPPHPLLSAESVLGEAPLHNAVVRCVGQRGFSGWLVCSIQSHKMSGLTVIADKPEAAAAQGAANTIHTV